MELINLKAAIEKSWSIDTTYKVDEWTEDNPAWGQCAVSAYLLNEMLLIPVKRCFFYYKGEERPHYYNEIEGKVLDLTSSQFDDSYTFFGHSYFYSKELIVNRWMFERYCIFKNAVLKNLNENSNTL